MLYIKMKMLTLFELTLNICVPQRQYGE